MPTQEDDLVVYGALRSGSTLLRLMINAHPSLHCPGEVDYIFDHLHFDKSSAKWIFDGEKIKTDRIFLTQGLTCPDTTDGLTAVRQMIRDLRSRSEGRLVIMIHRNVNAATELLETPRFLHLLRDPRDVAASSIGMGWAGNVYYGADHWIATEREWANNVSKIPESAVLTVKFEDLIADAQSNLSSICHFFGQQYSPKMLEYHENSTYEPVDPSLGSQWNSKRSKQEIALIELRVGSLLTRCGFEKSNVEPLEAGALMKGRLWLDNKIKTWKVRVSRYGLLDSLTVAGARRLGLETWASAAQLRINERAKRYLK